MSGRRKYQGSRRRLTSVIVAVAMIGGALAACSNTSDDRSSATPRSRPSDLAPQVAIPTPTVAVAAPGPHWFCLPRPPRTAADYRQALNHHDERWQGGDGGQPLTLPDGRIVWIFGDTTFGEIQSDGALVPGRWGLAHGSMLIQEGPCFDPFYGADAERPRDLVPSPGPGELYWPGGGWVGPDGSELLVVLNRIKVKAGAKADGFGFIPNGTAVARFRLPDLALIRVEQLPRPPVKGLAGWFGQPVHVGSWVYLYASDDRTQYVARMPDDTTRWSSSRRWQYWTGRRWSSSRSAMAPMVVEDPPWAGVAVSVYRSEFRAIAKTQEGFSKDVGAWAAPTPAGPWTALGTVADASTKGRSLSYAAHAATNIAGTEPLLVWSVSARGANSTRGSGISVQPMPD